MVNFNKSLLPIKAHYFFFMAALGPILPQLSVYGKQLGISSIVMGSVTGILPFLFLIAKPIFGLLADVFRERRKTIFISLILIMIISYASLHFVPPRALLHYDSEEVHCESMPVCNSTVFKRETLCQGVHRAMCDSKCQSDNSTEESFKALLVDNYPEETNVCHTEEFEKICSQGGVCKIFCQVDVDADTSCLLKSPMFWTFILLMSIGTVAFNVANSITDAICFDVLGKENEMEYGMQRVWGTIGFGIAALLSGFLIDFISTDELKNYTPAFLLLTIFGLFDLLCCRKLKLPKIEKPKNIFKDLAALIGHTHIIAFIVFAILAGVIDSFIVYFMFWYLEDLAESTGNMHNIKLLEGITVAAETLGAEVIFFPLSGKILEKFGFGNTLSFCFFNYALRLGFLALLTNPWWIIPIEFAFQGPTYALMYTTIVAYASAISPPGASATMQGIMAGMDDGLGYALGSFLGGIIYKYIGGRNCILVFCALAALASGSHIVLYHTLLKRRIPKAGTNDVGYQLPPENATRLESE